MTSQWGEIIYTGTDIDGGPITGEKRYPTFTCGHCTNIVVVNPVRTRERKKCLHCMLLICEQSEICSTHCTPMHAMASDHFEDAGEHGRYVNAIMRGVTNVHEAETSLIIK